MRDREEREDFYQFLVDNIIMAKEKAREVIRWGISMDMSRVGLVEAPMAMGSF